MKTKLILGLSLAVVAITAIGLITLKAHEIISSDLDFDFDEPADEVTHDARA